MTWGTVSVWETLLLLAALTELVVHSRGLRASLSDRNELETRGVNGARRRLVRGHIRGHALRIVANVVIMALALYLMTWAAPASDRAAPVIVAGLLVIAVALMVDGLLDARDWRKLEGEG